MNKGPAYPKVSFLMPRPALDKANDFAKRNGMTLSEAMRLLIDAGLEMLAEAPTLEQAADREPAPPPRGNVVALQPTRGRFPRPQGA